MGLRRDTIVIGGSAGSIAVLRTLLAGLPAGLRASVSVVVHVSQDAPSQLDRILARATALPVVVPVDGGPLRESHVIVGPPGHHLAIEGDSVRLWSGPRENHVRPAIDVLFRSAAVARGPRVIGVLLSGTLHDGSAGLEAIRKRGGTTLVQDPRDAEFPGMPQTAIDDGQADAVVAADGLAKKLVAIVGEEVVRVESDDALELETAVARGEASEPAWNEMAPTAFVCPDCGGPLHRSPTSAIPRFRCRLGHAYGGDALLHGQSARAEEAIWTAARIMDDRAILYDEMAASSRGLSRDRAAARLTERAERARAHAGALRALLAPIESADAD